MEEYYCLTLWEPWASLIAKGRKKIETRTYPTQYRGNLIITAASKKLNKDDISVAKSLLKCLGYEEKSFRIHPGQIVAVAKIEDCLLMTPSLISQQTKEEIICGGWKEGNYAWVLKDIVDFCEQKIDIKGKQKLWKPEKEIIEKVESCLKK